MLFFSHSDPFLTHLSASHIDGICSLACECCRKVTDIRRFRIRERNLTVITQLSDVGAEDVGGDPRRPQGPAEIHGNRIQHPESSVGTPLQNRRLITLVNTEIIIDLKSPNL